MAHELVNANEVPAGKRLDFLAQELMREANTIGSKVADATQVRTVIELKAEIERRFDANVVLWADDAPPEDWTSNQAGAYVDLHEVSGRKERVDQNHVKYFLELKPGEKRFVTYSVSYKRRKVPPELNTYKRREPL